MRNDGSLDNDKVGRALLTHRNTPCKELNMSPAQLLFGRNLRDHLPAVKDQLRLRKEWMLNQTEREKALAQRYGRVEEKLKQSCRTLRELEVGDHVQIQNRHGNEPLRWTRSRVVTEKMDYDQYTVRMDGSGRVTLRNRQHLRKITPRFGNQENLEDPIDSDGAGGVRRSERSSCPVRKYQAGF